MNRTAAKAKINSYIDQLKSRQPEMENEFAEGLATYMVLNGIKKSTEARLAVWAMGKDGLAELRQRVDRMV